MRHAERIRKLDDATAHLLRDRADSCFFRPGIDLDLFADDADAEACADQVQAYEDTLQRAKAFEDSTGFKPRILTLVFMPEWNSGNPEILRRAVLAIERAEDTINEIHDRIGIPRQASFFQGIAEATVAPYRTRPAYAQNIE